MYLKDVLKYMRTDCGTENYTLAMIQPMLCHDHNDDFAGEKSHIYGRSTSNQVAIGLIRCSYVSNEYLLC